MELLPVLDLMEGQVVRGLAGQREYYQPNTSRLVASRDPVETLMALKQAFQPHWMYVADLDAIRHGVPPTPILQHLVACGVPLVVDAGVSTVSQARHLTAMGIAKVVVGLETLPSLDMLSELVAELGADRIIFSLDLHDGNPIGPAGAHMHPIQIVETCIQAGIRQLIVLEFSRIGTSRGVPTGPLCHSIKERHAEVIVWTGGGVQQIADLHRLLLSRVDGVMVASALHEGQITPADWQAFEALDVDNIMLAMDA